MKTSSIATPAQSSNASPGRLLKMKDVAHELSLHRATVYRMIRAGEFPEGKPLTRARSRVVWTEREVEAWKIQRLQNGPG